MFVFYLQKAGTRAGCCTLLFWLFINLQQCSPLKRGISCSLTRLDFPKIHSLPRSPVFAEALLEFVCVKEALTVKKKRVNDSLKEANCKDFLLLGVAEESQIKRRGKRGEHSNIHEIFTGQC